MFFLLITSPTFMEAKKFFFSIIRRQFPIILKIDHLRKPYIDTGLLSVLYGLVFCATEVQPSPAFQDTSAGSRKKTC